MILFIDLGLLLIDWRTDDDDIAKLNHRHTNTNALCVWSFINSANTSIYGGGICLEWNRL